MATTIAVLVNPTNPNNEAFVSDLQAAARALWACTSMSCTAVPNETSIQYSLLCPGCGQAIWELGRRESLHDGETKVLVHLLAVYRVYATSKRQTHRVLPMRHATLEVIALLNNE
jgi:hypothetical protein